MDARLLNSENMALLAKTCIKPLRIAFDFIEIKDLYISQIKLAKDNGILNLSNYVLYNYIDNPSDFYERLKINVVLNEELGTKIYSFPMKFIPLTAKDRSYVGKYWNRKLLRGVQCILLATRGMVSPKRSFFEAAFGKNHEEFIKIAMMPENYIIYREEYKNNGAFDWQKLYVKLNNNQKQILSNILSKKIIDESDLKNVPPSNLRKLIFHYIEAENNKRKRKALSKNSN